jgi:DNA-binding IclR family transcriptional regulator
MRKASRVRAKAVSRANTVNTLLRAIARNAKRALHAAREFVRLGSARIASPASNAANRLPFALRASGRAKRASGDRRNHALTIDERGNIARVTLA